MGGGVQRQGIVVALAKQLPRTEPKLLSRLQLVLTYGAAEAVKMEHLREGGTHQSPHLVEPQNHLRNAISECVQPISTLHCPRKCSYLRLSSHDEVGSRNVLGAQCTHTAKHSAEREVGR